MKSVACIVKELKTNWPDSPSSLQTAYVVFRLRVPGWLIGLTNQLCEFPSRQFSVAMM